MNFFIFFSLLAVGHTRKASCLSKGCCGLLCRRNKVVVEEQNDFTPIVADMPSVNAEQLAKMNGYWELDGRINYGEVLKMQSVPEEQWEAASQAPDYWTQEFAGDGTGFHMLHKIPAANFEENYAAKIDGAWHEECPYVVATAALHGDGQDETLLSGQWRHTWDMVPQGEDWPYAAVTGPSFKTEVVQQGGNVLKFWRALLEDESIGCKLFVEKDGEVVAGPSYCRFVKKDADVRPPALAPQQDEMVQTIEV